MFVTEIAGDRGGHGSSVADGRDRGGRSDKGGFGERSEDRGGFEHVGWKEGVFFSFLIVCEWGAGICRSRVCSARGI